MSNDFSDNDSVFPFRDDEHYWLLRNKLIAFFNRRRCPVAEDLADETLARLVKFAAQKRAVDAELGDPDAVAFGIARNVYFEWLRQSGRTDEFDDDSASDDTTPGSDFSRYVAAISVGALRSSERNLLEEYFLDGIKAKDLARRMGITAVAVRGRIFQLRRRLDLSIGQMTADHAVSLRPML